MQNSSSIIYLDHTDSTNLEMWRMIDSGQIEKELTVLQAGSQSKGRGLGQTSWESEPGKNLLFSVFLKPVFLAPGKQFMLSKAITLGIRDSLAASDSKSVYLIKWPNDIYAGRSKVAGTLIETRIMGKALQACVAGTGVNVNQKIFPGHIPNPVSLALLTGRRFDVAEVLQETLTCITRYYNLLKRGDFEHLDTAYLEHLLGYNKTMTYKTGDRQFEAMITGVTQNGKLRLCDNRGETREYVMKEVALVV